MRTMYKNLASESENAILPDSVLAPKQQGQMQHLDKIQILHLEDTPSDAELINTKLKRANIHFDILVVDTKEEYLAALQEYTPDIVLADHSLPSFDSHEALSIIQETGRKIPFILITNTMSDEFAVDMIRKGADDYILKDRLNRLPSAILSAIEKHRFAKEKRAFEQQLLKNEKKFRALVEHSFDGVAIFNSDSIPTYVSQSIQHILGYSIHEAMQLALYNIIHPEDCKKAKALVLKSLKKPGSTIKTDVLRLKNSKEDWIWLEVSLTNMLYDETVRWYCQQFSRCNREKTSREKTIDCK